MGARVPFSVPLDAATLAQVKQEAERDGVSAAEWVRRAQQERLTIGLERHVPDVAVVVPKAP